MLALFRDQNYFAGPNEEDVGLPLDKSLNEKCQAPSSAISKHYIRHCRPLRLGFLCLKYIHAWLILLYFELLPSFVSARFFPTAAVTRLPSPKIHATSWLDGLRGIAAMCVVNCHWIGKTIGTSANAAYGAEKPGVNTTLWNLPGIRLLYGGTPHVCVFFVISGYALSIRPVQLAAKGDTAGSMNAYSSSIFRRFFRLYLPLWASTIGMWYYQYQDLDTAWGIRTEREFTDWWRYPQAVENLNSPLYTPGLKQNSTNTSVVLSAVVKRASRALPLSEQLSRLASANLKSTTIFEASWGRGDLANTYNPPSWTIPVEYRASLMLFLVQIALAQMKPIGRMTITAILIVFSVLVDRYEMILFLSGYLLAQLEPYITKYESSLKSWRENKMRNLWLGHNACMALVFLLGIHVLSYPQSCPEHTPGFKWMAYHTPSTMKWMPYWFWLGTGAVLTVFGVSRLAWLRGLCSSPFCQYIGQVSFSLYLVHQLVELSLGTAWLYRALEITHNLDRHNWPLFELTLGTSLIFIYACSIWFADVFTRFVDIPSVRFTKWLEQKLRA